MSRPALGLVSAADDGRAIAPQLPGERSAFGALLRRYRLVAGLSQDELAERAGLSIRGISDLERGLRRSPHPATLRRLADALGLDAQQRAALLTSASGQAPPPLHRQVDPEELLLLAQAVLVMLGRTAPAAGACSCQRSGAAV